MAQNIIDTKIREAYDTEANWTKYNPILLAGQLAFSSDKYAKYKVGNGNSKWSELPYNTLSWTDITGKPSSFTPSTHTHVISQITDIKNASVNYATTAGAVPWSGVSGKPATFPPSSHTHDDRYYTESEANTRFSPKTGSSELANLAAIITLGSGDAGTIYQKGSTYQQKLEIMDNSTTGDDVFVFSQSKNSGQTFDRLMSIHDDGNIVANKFTGALSGNASSASSVPWSGITGKPSSFTPSSHTHTASQITGLPTKLPNPQLLTFTGAANTKYDGSGAITVHIPTTSATPSSLAIQLNGGTTEGTNKFTFNGSAAKTVNITPSVIGAATVSHTHSQYAPTSHKHMISQITDIGSASVNYATTSGTANAVAWNNVSGKPTSMQNPYALTISNYNASQTIQYDGSSEKTLNITSNLLYGASDAPVGYVQEKSTTGMRYVKIISAESSKSSLYQRFNQQFLITGINFSFILTLVAYQVNNSNFQPMYCTASYLTISQALPPINKFYIGLTNIDSSTNKIEIWYEQAQWQSAIAIIPLGRSYDGKNNPYKLYEVSSTANGMSAKPTFISSIPLFNAARNGLTLYSSTGQNIDGTMTQKAITDALGTKALKEHTHNYAGSSSAGGAANSANMLNANAGSSTQPVYFSGGKPVACTYTLGKSVPSNAVFTDTNTWRPIQDNLTSTSTTDSLSANQGRILKGLIDSKAPSSHSHTIANITNLQSALDGKASVSHNHDTIYAKSSHSHNTINDCNSGTSIGISSTLGIVPSVSEKYDIVVTNTSEHGNKFVTLDKTIFANYLIDTIPLKAITNTQIDSLASL